MIHREKGELLCATLIYAVLILGVQGVRAQNTIHILHGVVTAVRKVKANANVLGASATIWGDVSCDNIPIKQSSIFRVETASHYYDLSKICKMSSMPLFNLLSLPVRHSRQYPQKNTWNNWEQLRVGDRVEMLLGTTTITLFPSRCQQAGMISKSVLRKIQRIPRFSDWSPLPFNKLSNRNMRNMKKWESRCTYEVPIIHIKIRLVSTDANTGNLKVNTVTWEFRVIGRGPKTSAATHPIGLHYPGHRPLFNDL